MRDATDPPPLLLAGREFAWGARTYVMGILNITPDSFSGDGLAESPERAPQVGEAMVAAGADIIDIGGESSRPGASSGEIEEELRRTIPTIRALAALGVPISIDTRHSAVAVEALEAGAHLVNDITALTGDPGMVDVVRASGAAVCLMHMLGTPETMQRGPAYDDVVAEVGAYLEQRVGDLVAEGIPRDRIIVDPGIGFGKTVEHNIALLGGIAEIRARCACPVLVGTSRKSFIGKVLDAEPVDRAWGTAATVAFAITRGADMVRVHDVREMAQVARMTDALAR